MDSMNVECSFCSVGQVTSGGPINCMQLGEKTTKKMNPYLTN
jgi:hypothetical protein